MHSFMFGNQERQQLKDGADPCLFRIASEGLPVLLPHMTKQIVIAPRKDFIQLLANKVVSFSYFNDPAFSAALQNLKHGCCVVALPSGRFKPNMVLLLSHVLLLFSCFQSYHLLMFSLLLLIQGWVLQRGLMQLPI